MNFTVLTTSLFLAISHGPLLAQATTTAPDVELRMRQTLESMADRPSPFEGAAWNLRHAYARQLAGREKDAALLNKATLDYCASYTPDKDIALHPYSNPRPEATLFSVYLEAKTSGLLTPESRDAIEEVCWRWVYRHSNLKSPLDGKGRPWPLNNPKENVWIIIGSENHDAIQRAANLFSLQILMKAGAPYGPDAKLHDGFTVAEHYREWLRWYPEFFRQRIRMGLDSEIAHPSSYGSATIGSYLTIANLTDSAEVKQAAEHFLTVFWATVACEFEPRTGIRGGLASTRCYKFSWNQTGTDYWARPLLYAYGWTEVKSEPNLGTLEFFTASYRPPEILRAIASDPDRPPYMGTHRRFGRGGRWHYGIYQVLFDDGEAQNSYLLRDIYYTNDYTLSTLSFDPAREYIGLVSQSRMMGVTFSHDIDDRIVVSAGNTPVDSKREYKMPTLCGTNGMLRPDCMIVARDPNAGMETTNSTRIFLSDGALWDNRVEEGGWIFTRAGDGYAAIRIAGDKGYATAPSPWNYGQYLDINDIWAPVVIQTGQAGKFESFDAFKAAVKAQPFTYAEGKLSYTALNGENYEFHSNSKTLPTINGKPLDLNPPLAYDFPYLSMQHGSNKAVVKYPGFDDLMLEF